jgi:hypothetical protein
MEPTESRTRLTRRNRRHSCLPPLQLLVYGRPPPSQKALRADLASLTTLCAFPDLRRGQGGREARATGGEGPTRRVAANLVESRGATALREAKHTSRALTACRTLWAPS